MRGVSKWFIQRTLHGAPPPRRREKFSAVQKVSFPVLKSECHFFFSTCCIPRLPSLNDHFGVHHSLKYPAFLRHLSIDSDIVAAPMSSEVAYRPQPFQKARPCFPERTRPEFRAVFHRLAADQEFRSLKTFRNQAHYAKRFVDADETIEKAVSTRSWQSSLMWPKTRVSGPF